MKFIKCTSFWWLVKSFSHSPEVFAWDDLPPGMSVGSPPSYHHLELNPASIEMLQTFLEKLTSHLQTNMRQLDSGFDQATQNSPNLNRVILVHLGGYYPCTLAI